VRPAVIFATICLALSALVSCGRGQSPSLDSADKGGPPASTDLTVVAKNTAFNPTTLKAPAGQALAITFRNEDAINHSFHLFGGSAGDVKTTPKPGPTEEVLSVTLTFPGSYTYQCDVHPNADAMKGTLVVVKT
jgi:plastocyanin